MRLSLLALLATGLAACQSPSTDTPADATPRAVSSSAAAPEFSVEVDSLLVDEPDLLFTVALGYPQLASAAGALPEAARAINAAIADSMEAIAASYRPSEPPPAGADRPAYTTEIAGGTERPFIGGGVFSALVEVYAYTGGAHGMTFFRPLVFDLETGAALTAADLFRPDAPWGDTLAAYVERSVLDRLTRVMGDPVTETSFYPEGLDSIRAGQVGLTLDADSVTVHIPPYQLSYYAAGAFHVGVPLAAVAPYARGPLARLAER